MINGRWIWTLAALCALGCTADSKGTRKADSGAADEQDAGAPKGDQTGMTGGSADEAGATAGSDGGDVDASGPTGPSVGERLRAAEALNADWCVVAQRTLAHLEGTTLENQISNTSYESLDEFISSKALIDSSAMPQLEVQTYVLPFAGAKADVEAQSDQVFCKTRSQERIELSLNVDLMGMAGTCRDMNQRALDGALEQLTASEKARYESDGKVLQMGDDLTFGTGAEWSSTPSTLARVDGQTDTYAFRSSALASAPLPVVAGPGPDDIFGVLYCKRISPAHAFDWLTRRAFEADPLAP